jgi:SnoaL-like domain
MSAADSAQAAMKAWEVHDANTFASYLADDFVCKGPLPQPLNKEQSIGYMKAMMTAMPDWSFNAHILHEQGDTVLFVTQITAHTPVICLCRSFRSSLPQARKSPSLTNTWSTLPTAI